MGSESQETMEAQKACVACGREFPAGTELCPDDGTLLTPIGKEPKIGDIFGERYEILGIIGDGGMGKVYKARHNLMKRIVAIKLLLPHLVSSASALKRFQQEAQAASALNHPNILTVYDFGISAQGMPFLVMDFLEGTSLSALIQEKGHLDVARALPIFIQACAGLAHAHQKGVIHRDLKPANMMLVDYDGQPDYLKVVDFGIAKLLQPDNQAAEPLTHTGEIFGSPLYMSPEQCRGLDLDQRSDIYSLGCVLYRCVTGRPPFAGGTPMECMYKQVNDEAVPFSNCCPELNLSDDLEAVIFKAMAKLPDDRYQNMMEFHQALEALSAQYPAGKKITRVFSVPPGSPEAVSVEELTDKIKKDGDSATAMSPSLPASQSSKSTSNALKLPLVRESNTGDVTDVESELVTDSYLKRAGLLASRNKMIIGGFATVLILGGIAIFIQNSNKQEAIPPASAPLRGDPNQQAQELLTAGTQAMDQGDYAQAVTGLERAVKYTEEMSDPVPALLNILPQLARAYSQCDKFESAQHTLERLLPLQKKQLGTTSIPVARTKTGIALALIAQGDLDDAVPLLNDAKASYRGVKPEKQEGYSDVLYGLAKVKTQQGQYAQAISTLNQAIAQKAKTAGADSPEAAAYMDDLAQVYLLQNKIPQAESILNKALSIKQEKLGTDSLQVADTLKNMGTLNFQKGDLPRSEEMFNKALAIKKKDLGADSLGAAEIMTALAMLYTRERKYPDADTLFKQALAIRTKQLGAYAPSVKRTEELYSVLKRKMQSK